MYHVLLMLVLVIGLSCLLAQHVHATEESSPQWTEPFFFIQMTDPQFGMFAKNENFEKETTLFEKAIVAANRLQPRFVVVCGDLINTPEDPEQTAELLRIAEMLDDAIPLYWVSGNHDLKATPDGLAWYREHLGDDWYAFDHAGCRFIVLNTTIIHQPDKVKAEVARQREWFAKELARTAKTEPAHIILFQHHPWFLSQPDEDDGYFNIPKAVRADYLGLLREHSVRAAFAGHYHRNSYGKDGAMEMVTSAPIGLPLGDDPSGLRIVKVFEEHIEHTYYGFDALPDQVTLTPQSATNIRMGMFRRTDLLVAFYKSDTWAATLKPMMEQHRQAEEAGDSEKVKELEARGEALQEMAHRQLAGEAPLTNVLEHLQAKWADIAKEADVALIVEEPLFRNDRVEWVDVTELLVKQFAKQDQE